MALTFVNVKTGERRVCHTEPMIAAHLNTSDRNPNAMFGQDMGWRLSPETVIELERIKNDAMELQTVAARAGIMVDNIAESDILTYISNKNDRAATGAETRTEDFNRAYEDDIRRLREEQAKRDEIIRRERAAEGTDKPIRPLISEKELAPTDDGLETIDELPETSEEINTTETDENGSIDEGESTTAKPKKASTKVKKES